VIASQQFLAANPSLRGYEERIEYYQKIQDDVAKQMDTITFKWLRIDSRPAFQVNYREK